MPYTITFEPEAREDVKQFRKYRRTAVLDAIERFLRHSPGVEQGTRIKEMEQPAISQFRLRVGRFRVYYDIDEEVQEVDIVRVCDNGRLATKEVTQDETD